MTTAASETKAPPRVTYDQRDVTSRPVTPASTTVDPAPTQIITTCSSGRRRTGPATAATSTRRPRAWS